jgi:hypothetical protein
LQQPDIHAACEITDCRRAKRNAAPRAGTEGHFLPAPSAENALTKKATQPAKRAMDRFYKRHRTQPCAKIKNLE